MTSDARDRHGPAARGSQLQIQIYVNRRHDELTAAALTALPTLAEQAAKISWVAPLASSGFSEPRDRDFLAAVGLEDRAESLAKFWPLGGPVWDALAIVKLRSGDKGVILAEGKSYPREMRTAGGCTATAERSIEMIREGLRVTQQWLGVSATPETWMGPLYQHANRLAHLYWLREVEGVEAWFCHLLVLDDPTHHAAGAGEWSDAVREAEHELGLGGRHIPWAGHAFLTGRPAEELVG
jgi:hypothetical protein